VPGGLQRSADIVTHVDQRARDGASPKLGILVTWVSVSEMWESRNHARTACSRTAGSLLANKVAGVDQLQLPQMLRNGEGEAVRFARKDAADILGFPLYLAPRGGGPRGVRSR
jgi:hypothetical protein